MKLIGLFAVLSSLVLCACQSAPKVSIPIIDAHTHLDFDGKNDESSGFPNTETEFLRQAREAGVVAVVTHAPRKGSEIHPVKDFRVISCMAVISKTRSADAERLLARGKYRCLKIYLGYEPKWATDPFYEQFYRLAEKYQVPVVFHTGDTYDIDAPLKYADPLTIDEVAIRHRKVNFVIAHLGNPWIQTAAEVAYKNPNVYLEASALIIGPLSEKDPAAIDDLLVKPVAWAFRYVENPAKFIFGTDWPLVNIKEYRDAFAKAIPPEHWQAVFYDNAARVFRIQKP